MLTKALLQRYVPPLFIHTVTMLLCPGDFEEVKEHCCQEGPPTNNKGKPKSTEPTSKAASKTPKLAPEVDHEVQDKINVCNPDAVFEAASTIKLLSKLQAMYENSLNTEGRHGFRTCFRKGN